MARLLLFVFAARSLCAGSISGVVVDQTGAVIVNATVVLSGENGEKREAKCDQEGRFVIADLEPGRYSIEVSSPGFIVTKIKSVTITEGETRLSAIELIVAPGPACEPNDKPVGLFTPLPSGRSQLSGEVFVDGTKPAAGASVLLYEPKGHRRVGSAVADSNGDFFIMGLRPGLYQLQLHLRGFAELIMERVEIRSGFRSETYISLTRCPHRSTCPAEKWAAVAICL